MVRFHLLGPLELLGRDGRDVRALLAQPKRLAVLGFLAARPAGTFVRRDVALGLFWPELPQDAARRSLRQTLHVLREHLGADAVVTRGDDDVALHGGVVACDVPHFLDATVARRHVEALDLYRGELFAGFYLGGATSAFEQWLDDERARLRSLAAASARELVGAAERAGDLAGAAGWARRELSVAPDDEPVVRRLMQLLEAAGDRAGALRAYEAFARRLARELDGQPATETRAVAERLRIRPRPTPEASRLDTPASLPVVPTRIRRRSRWPLVALAGLIGATALTMLVLESRPTATPVLAVGAIDAADTTGLSLAARTLPELLATDLGRVDGLSVIDHPRLQQVTAQLAATGQASSAAEAAAAAGATELLVGTLYRVRGDSLRLDLRRVDARRGVVRDAVSVSGHDVFALADSAAARFARRLHRPSPSPGLETVTSPPLVAHGLYDEGLRAYYRGGDYREAARLFEAALDEDSTFAMAAYYLGRSRETLDPATGGDAYARAALLAGRATPREALLIRVQWPAAQNEPGWRTLAESLAAREPGVPESRYARGLARMMAGDHTGAARDFRAAIRLDSLSLRAASGRCVACDAYERLVADDLAADSIETALHDAAEWLRVAPRAPRAWDLRSAALERVERLAEALAARDTAARLRGAAGATALDTAYFRIRVGDLAAADRLLRAAMRSPSPEVRGDANWWRMIGLRAAGRPRAAEPLARRVYAGVPDSEPGLREVALGAALFEAGEYRAAARAFDSAGVHSASFRRAHPGLAARHRAWGLAQRATVAGADGDTAALRVLAESIAVEARGSAYGRDWTLPAYAHGLRLEHSGRLTEAADSFRAAVFSPTEGYTRVNYELARTLLALGRPRDAVPWMQAVLRGGLEASNFFLTRSDAEELLARCFAAAGETDSARVHYAWVVRAWSDAEPSYRGRRAAARAYLMKTGGREAGGR